MNTLPSHRSLLSILNPFKKQVQYAPDNHKLLVLECDEMHHTGYGSPSPGTKYTLTLRGLNGNVRHIVRWQAF